MNGVLGRERPWILLKISLREMVHYSVDLLRLSNKSKTGQEGSEGRERGAPEELGRMG